MKTKLIGIIALSASIMAMAGIVGGLAGCTDQKAEIKTAYNEYFSSGYHVNSMKEGSLPVAVADPVIYPQPVIHTVMYVAQEGDTSAKAQAFASLEKQGWVTAEKSQGYLLKNGSIASLTPVDTKSDDYQAMLSSLKHINADTTFSVTASDPGFRGTVITTYIPFSNNGWNGEQDQSFFTAVPQGSTSPLAKFLTALAAKGVLTQKNADVYWNGMNQIIGKIDPSHIGYGSKTVPVSMYFKNDKTDGLISMDYNRFILTMVKVSFGKPLTFTAEVNRGLFGSAGMVYTSNIESNSVVTELATMPEVKDLLSYGDLHNLKALDEKAGTSIVKIRVVAYGPNSNPSASMGESKYNGGKPITYITYEPAKDHTKVVDYGTWQQGDVIHADKDDGKVSAISATVRYVFKSNPALSSVKDLSTFLGYDIIKDGATKDIQCQLNVMKEGYQVSSCTESEAHSN